MISIFYIEPLTNYGGILDINFDNIVLGEQVSSNYSMCIFDIKEACTRIKQKKRITTSNFYAFSCDQKFLLSYRSISTLSIIQKKILTVMATKFCL